MSYYLILLLKSSILHSFVARTRGFSLLKKKDISKNTHLLNKVYSKKIIQVHTELNMPYIQYRHGRLKYS